MSTDCVLLNIGQCKALLEALVSMWDWEQGIIGITQFSCYLADLDLYCEIC